MAATWSIFNMLDTLSMDALKPLAYMRYMRILFLIATSRTDYDTPRDLYARSRHTHTTIPWRLASNQIAQAQSNSNSFPNYRSFRSRERLSASMLLSRDSCMKRKRMERTASNLDGIRMETCTSSRYVLSCIELASFNRRLGCDGMTRLPNWVCANFSRGYYYPFIGF